MPPSPDILQQIFAHKRLAVREARQVRSLEAVRAAAEAAPDAPDFLAALHPAPGGAPALIAEIKRASPSRGLLVQDLDPLALAQIYAANGAAAISVLTDRRFFRGSLSDLQTVARGLKPPLPVLRKDFICDPYQLYTARAAGASAVLLIVAGLEFSQLVNLYALSRELGLAVLVEVHDRAELEIALRLEPALIGVNNRDLRTFNVDIHTTLELRRHVPPGVRLVAESGIHTASAVQRLAEAGVDAILVGEALVTAPDTAAKVRELALVADPGLPVIEVSETQGQG